MKSPFVLFILMLLAPSISAETVGIAVGDYAPYIEFSAKNKGFMTEIVVRSFAEVNIEVDLKNRPWKRVEEMEVPKKKMLSFAYIRSKKREKIFFFSDELMTAPTAFVVRKEKNFSWSTLADLKSYRIGVSRGYSYVD